MATREFSSRARALLVALTTLAVGCTPGLDGDPSAYLQVGPDGGVCDPPAFIAMRCGESICHDANSPAAGLDLVSPDPASRLLGIPSSCDELPLVDPDRREHSYLLEKVETLRPRCGSTMPLGARHLDANELACFQQFLEGL